MAPPLCFSLSGAGFLGVYHLGVALALQRHLPASVLQTVRVAGASAGALVGSALVCGAPLQPCMDAFLAAAAQVRQLWGGAFNPNAHLDRVITHTYARVFPAGGHTAATERLYVSLTRLPVPRNLLVTGFTSEGDLLDALMCSSYIPGFTAARPPTFRGTYYVDGGFSNNTPHVPGAARTHTVAPFDGAFDVCPTVRASGRADHEGGRAWAGEGWRGRVAVAGYYPSVHNVVAAARALHPPDTAGLEQLHTQGYDHMLAYMRSTLGVPISPTVPGTDMPPPPPPPQPQRQPQRPHTQA
jgi:hypothetical protein